MRSTGPLPQLAAALALGRGANGAQAVRRAGRDRASAALEIYADWTAVGVGYLRRRVAEHVIEAAQQCAQSFTG